MTHSVVTIDTRDGRCEAHVFTPAGTGPWPAVIMYMDGLGIRPAMIELGERLAAHGYFVLLPDLFYRSGTNASIDATTFHGDVPKRNAWMSKYMAPVTTDAVREDTRAFLAFLDGRADVKGPKIGTTGYCMGGRLSFAMAGCFPERIAAAASYHGGRLATDAPDSPHLLVPQMKGRIYVAGAIEDASFPDEMKARVEAALTAAHVDHEVVTYPAKHGWVPSDTPVHDPAMAERHWRTLFALLDGTLPR
jgi:carboxymethylenebutenolidase